jgi:hypothetical protein
VATYSLFDVGACNCTSTCNATFTVQGCGSAPISGATVTANGVSGTTDGSGNVTLNVGSAGTYTVTVTGVSARFASFSQSIAVTCSSTHVLSLSAASGFVCTIPCALPISTTLNLTTNCSELILAGGTLTWNGTSWSGTIFPDLNLTYSGDCTIAPTTETCPPSFELIYDIPGGTDCNPTPACTATATE